MRYKRLIKQHADQYVQIDTSASDRTFFEGNLEHSIHLKLQGDRKKDNALYRIAASSISASVEDLVNILIEKFALKGHQKEKKTFGDKLKIIEANLERPSI